MTDIQLLWLNAMIERENKIEKRRRDRMEIESRRGRIGKSVRRIKIP